MSDAALPYIVRGQHKTGARTFHCPTAHWALRKLNDFHRSGYTSVTATGPNGILSEDDLNRLITEEAAQSSGAPVNLDVPNAPELVA